MLRNLSLVLTLLNILIIFYMLFDSRLSAKKTIIWTSIMMGGLIVANGIGFYLLGINFMAKYFLLTCTIPSWLFFFLIAKRRNGQFFFTFCIADIFGICGMCVTYFIALPFDHNEWVLLLSRILLFTLTDILIYRYLRTVYHRIMDTLVYGWGLWAAISILIYILLGLYIGWPTPIQNRPDAVPVFILVLSIVILIFIAIFRTVKWQMDYADQQADQAILLAQIQAFRSNINELLKTKEQMEIRLHDVRHKARQLSSLLADGKNKESIALLNHEFVLLDQTSGHRYCKNVTVNAILRYYITKAQQEHVHVDTKVDIPNTLKIDEDELSTVFANAIENAILACRQIPEGEEKEIRILCSAKPQFFLKITNNYRGLITFDKNGVPISYKKGHGIGLRSILAFAQKNKALLDFSADGQLFSFIMII